MHFVLLNNQKVGPQEQRVKKHIVWSEGGFSSRVPQKVLGPLGKFLQRGHFLDYSPPLYGGGSRNLKDGYLQKSQTNTLMVILIYLSSPDFHLLKPPTPPL